MACLALVKITLMHACMCIYCYMQINCFFTESRSAYMYKCGALYWAIYMMLITYIIYMKVGKLVDTLQ